MPSLHGLSHLEILFQKVQSLISIVLLAAQNHQLNYIEGGVKYHMIKYTTMGKKLQLTDNYYAPPLI